MSKKNALIELWYILYDPKNKKAGTKTLFEWRHLHLRAVWQAEDVSIPKPENLIVIRRIKKKDVAAALVDVVQSKDNGDWFLLMRPLVIRVAVAKKKAVKVWGTQPVAPILIESEPQLWDNVSFPSSSVSAMTKIFMEVYSRSGPKYTNFMKRLNDVWRAEEIGFLKRATEDLGVSVTAENWSMGITLKGLGYQPESKSSIIKIPVASGTTLALKGLTASPTGVHYVGLGLGSLRKIKTENGKWINPLGGMFMDTLFLDSFSLNSHPENKPLGGWPKDGALAAFFTLPNGGAAAVYTHTKKNKNKDQAMVTIDDVESYLLRSSGVLKIQINKKEYSPSESISFLFDKTPKGDEALKRVRQGRSLMGFLTANPLTLEKITEVFGDKDISPTLVSKSKEDQKRVALKIFGNEKFLEELGDKDFEPEVVDEKAKEATESLNAEIAKARDILLDANNLQREFLARTKKAFPGKKKNAQTLTAILIQAKPKIRTSKDAIDGMKLTLAAVDREIFSARVEEIDELIGGLRTAWNSLFEAIQTQSRKFLTRDYKKIDSLMENLKTNVESANQTAFNITSDRISEALDVTRDLIKTAADYLEGSDNKEQENLRHLLIHHALAMSEATQTEAAKAAKADALLKKLETFKTESKKVTIEMAASRKAFKTAAEKILKLDPEKDRSAALVLSLRTYMESIKESEQKYAALWTQNEEATAASKKIIKESYDRMITARSSLFQNIIDQINAVWKQDFTRVAAQEAGILTNAIQDDADMKMDTFNPISKEVQNVIDSMKQLTELVKLDLDMDDFVEQQKALQDKLTELREDALTKLLANRKLLKEEKKKEKKTTAAGKAKRKGLQDAIDKLDPHIKALQIILKKGIGIKKLIKTQRQIIYGSAVKPTATILYMLGSRGRIDTQRIREDPIYAGAEVPNLSNLTLEFYGSSEAALTSQLSMSASIRAENLTPKAVTADGGRLEQTDFDYYYGLYWFDDYTGFETFGGSVSSFPGNYVAIPDHGALLYHLGANKVGSLSYDFGNMATRVPLDNPDFEIMLRIPAKQNTAAAPGSSRFFVSGAIILGLRMPESGGSGLYSVRSVVYAPNLVKM